MRGNDLSSPFLGAADSACLDVGMWSGRQVEDVDYCHHVGPAEDEDGRPGCLSPAAGHPSRSRSSQSQEDSVVASSANLRDSVFALEPVHFLLVLRMFSVFLNHIG